ncbi:hypothetical protein LCGC14_1759600, partial [marine sediment metagenome]
TSPLFAYLVSGNMLLPPIVLVKVDEESLQVI